MLSLAPVRDKSWRVNTIPTTVYMTDSKRTIATRLPMIFLIVFSSFLPIARDNTDAEPTPSMAAEPALISVNGYDTDMAPICTSPTICPTKMESIMLYSPTTTMPRTAGILSSIISGQGLFVKSFVLVSSACFITYSSWSMFISHV